MSRVFICKIPMSAEKRQGVLCDSILHLSVYAAGKHGGKDFGDK